MSVTNCTRQHCHHDTNYDELVNDIQSGIHVQFLVYYLDPVVATCQQYCQHFKYKFSILIYFPLLFLLLNDNKRYENKH